MTCEQCVDGLVVTFGGEWPCDECDAGRILALTVERDVALANIQAQSEAEQRQYERAERAEKAREFWQKRAGLWMREARESKCAEADAQRFREGVKALFDAHPAWRDELVDEVLARKTGGSAACTNERCDDGWVLCSSEDDEWIEPCQICAVYSFEPIAVSAEFHALIRDAVEESAESRRSVLDQREGL